MLTLFERGLVAHLVADWLLQNHWMAVNKGSLRHLASWTHGLIYAVCLDLALSSWQAGVVLGFLHVLIDTRRPLGWWQRLFRQTTTGPAALHVAIWSDQALHLIALALWIELVPR